MSLRAGGPQSEDPTPPASRQPSASQVEGGGLYVQTDGSLVRDAGQEEEDRGRGRGRALTSYAEQVKGREKVGRKQDEHSSSPSVDSRRRKYGGCDIENTDVDFKLMTLVLTYRRALRNQRLREEKARIEALIAKGGLPGKDGACGLRWSYKPGREEVDDSRARMFADG